MSPALSLSEVSDRPEHQLLLYCARTAASPELRKRIRELLDHKINWAYLFLLARRHAVVPLLYRQLQQSAADLVPDEELRKLKRAFQENAARNLLLAAELSRLIRLFAQSGVEAIPYKGPLLALFAYDDLALRRFVDLDVMVRKHDWAQARNVLLAEGYIPAKSLTTDQMQVLLRTQHNMQFTRDGGKYIVELHWEVASHLFASSVGADDLWRNLVTANLCDVPVRTLSAEDLLFSLCVHGSRHLWERLSWICDVAELIARQKISWAPLLRRSAKSDVERMFFLGLRLAQDLLGSSLPPEVREQVDADKHIDKLVSRIARRLFTGVDHVPATSREIFSYNFEVRKSWRARARYFVFMLKPTDRDLSVVTLPSGFDFGYYLLRPLRLLNKEH